MACAFLVLAHSQFKAKNIPNMNPYTALFIIDTLGDWSVQVLSSSPFFTSAET